MSAPHYVVRSQLTVRPAVVPGAADLLDEAGYVVARVDNEQVGNFLAEAHNAYVPALRKLIQLLHHDAIPAEWEDRMIKLGDIVDCIAELVPADSVGAPASPDEVRDAAIADPARAAADSLNGASA